MELRLGRTSLTKSSQGSKVGEVVGSIQLEKQCFSNLSSPHSPSFSVLAFLPQKALLKKYLKLSEVSFGLVGKQILKNSTSSTGNKSANLSIKED
jgi:hypothetical protein